MTNAKAYIFIWIVLVCAALAVPVSHAQDAPLHWPVDCVPGKTCWIMAYTDIEGRPQLARDYMCGEHSYDGHAGTDIALAEMRDATQGVAVLSAADGLVVAIADGAQDRVTDMEKGNDLRGGECGNSVVMEHPGGWQTRYCHLRRGSVVVRPGQNIAAGTKIGEIGMSGLSDWPHLHFVVMRNGLLFDPFSGRSNLEGCGKGKPLFQSHHKIPYMPIGVFNAGFDVKQPNQTQIEIGEDPIIAISRATPELYFWAGTFGLQKDDNVDLKVLDPKGKIFMELTDTVKAAKDRQFVFVGRARFDELWEPGPYTGILEIRRSLGPEPVTVRHIARMVLR